MLGPAAALFWLSQHPGQYRLLFVLAFMPGLLAVLATLLVREKRQEPSGQSVRPFWASFGYWQRAPASYRRIAGALLIFALFNSSDTLLLLLARQQGLSDPAVIGVYIFYNLIYAAAALPAGLLADRLGPTRVLVVGLLVFALVYGSATQVHSWQAFGALFGLYGLYAAATEGVGKACLSRLCAPTDKGAALGTFAGLSSLAALVASTLTGLVWQMLGAPAAFGLSAVAALGVALFLGMSARYDKQ
ncbi:MFS transporter [Hymenobacter cellulosilyticus]|uniref:MFS transporter n=1 Tax=Hymenobacter cellulosilyticus TaxID=2932248 RepID=A0A8T9QHS3_9BACT|nr:MFS transporter [Hymenobacter cellulosilyticus]UOQ74353.1 MFS transporter [Hymenobacter cellulosilyticus]